MEWTQTGTPELTQSRVRSANARRVRRKGGAHCRITLKRMAQQFMPFDGAILATLPTYSWGQSYFELDFILGASPYKVEILATQECSSLHENWAAEDLLQKTNPILWLKFQCPETDIWKAHSWWSLSPFPFSHSWRSTCLEASCKKRHQFWGT